MEIYEKDNGFHWRADFHEENISDKKLLHVNLYALYVMEYMKTEIMIMINDLGIDRVKHPKVDEEL